MEIERSEIVVRSIEQSAGDGSDKAVELLKQVKADRLLLKATISVLLLFPICWAYILIAKPDFAPECKRVRREQLDRMILICVTAHKEYDMNRYVYPRCFNREFANELISVAYAAKSGDAVNLHLSGKVGMPQGFSWLKTCLVKSKGEALERARQALEPKQILYCAVKRDEKIDGFFVLGTDENGDLITGVEPIVFDENFM